MIENAANRTKVHAVRGGLYPQDGRLAVQIDFNRDTWKRLGSPALIEARLAYRTGDGPRVRVVLTASAARGENVWTVGDSAKKTGSYKRIQISTIDDVFTREITERVSIDTVGGELVERKPLLPMLVVEIPAKVAEPEPEPEPEPDPDRPFAGTKPLPYKEQVSAMSRSEETLELHREQINLLRSQTEAIRQFYDRTVALNRRSTAALESIATSLKVIVPAVVEIGGKVE